MYLSDEVRIDSVHVDSEDFFVAQKSLGAVGRGGGDAPSGHGPTGHRLGGRHDHRGWMHAVASNVTLSDW